ncbi:MAG: acyl--CoA ligase [Deltaproteobacteria bacterium]|nr:acyl--CoA ligase [Deltaproteobacteria bacterium]
MSVLVRNPADTTLGAALGEVARLRPDQPALLSPARTLTWAALDDEVDRLAALLDRVGVQPGDPVGLMCSRRVEVVTTFLACARLGAVATPVAFALRPDRVADQFETLGMVAVLTERGFDPLLERLGLSDRRKVVYVGPPGSLGDTRYDEIAKERREPPSFRARPDTVCYLNVTSGTTGRPKGARTTHRNILVNALSGIEGLGFTDRDVFFGMFSVFSHPHELFHRSLLVGGPAVVAEATSPRAVYEMVARFRVTWVMAVPTFYQMMLDLGGTEGHDLGSLRVLEAGGDPVPEDTILEMERRFGVSFLPVWGSTETTGVVLASAPGRPRKPGSLGRPVPHYEVHVAGPGGRDVPAGEVGELWIRGPGVCSGYQNRPEETAACFEDGWLHTGDLVRRDAEGFFHLVGRASDMIKVAGLRVYPLELEQAIRAHPDVQEVVVVRHPERLRGHVPRAIVVARPGTALDPRGLRAFCRERLATFQIPRIFEIWKEIPRLPDGKVDRAAILARPSPPRGCQACGSPSPVR